MAEIINLRENQNTPDDLMTLKEVVKKYGIKYHFIYKWSCRLGVIPVYDKGGIAISEQDYLNFRAKRAMKWQAS
jgi:hypothetical protein